MRAMPSPISSTVPTSVRSAEPVSMPSIRSRRIDAISSGLISIAAFVPFLRRSGDALSQFLEPVPDARIQDHVPHLHDQPAEDFGVHLALELDDLTGLPLDLRADLPGYLGVELDGAGHGHSEPLVLLGPERLELLPDPEEDRHAVLLQQEIEEVDQLRLSAGDGLRESVLLLGGREVGAEEEELQLAVVRERVGELAE